MKKIYILSSLWMAPVFANPVDEALLVKCQLLGHSVYYSCIATPPLTSEQQSYCLSIYSQYNAELVLLNVPYPLLPTHEPSPFSWSPYDVCRYETAFMVLFDLCPSSII